MILQLVYISTMRRPFSEADAQQVLAASRRNNARDGITGLLVIGGSRFLQLLEGPPALVRRAYERIRADERHFACVIIKDREVDARACADWAMGHLAGGDPTGATTLADIVERLVAPIEDLSLRAQFTGFAELQKGAA